LVEGAYTQQERAHSHRLHPVGTTRLALSSSFFLPGGFALTAGPARSRPLGRSAPALAQRTGGNPLLLFAPQQEGQMGVQEPPHNTEGLPLFSRGAVCASW
jgi:hypothetical protein